MRVLSFACIALGLLPNVIADASSALGTLSAATLPRFLVDVSACIPISQSHVIFTTKYNFVGVTLDANKINRVVGLCRHQPLEQQERRQGPSKPHPMDGKNEKIPLQSWPWQNCP